MGESGDGESLVSSAFLVHLASDRQKGIFHPLEHYQALFPGHAEVIAREYTRLVEDTGPRPAVNSPSAGSGGQLSTLTLKELLGVPRQIGPYRILETIGQGGMGVVYSAEETSPLRRRVALKLVKIGMDTREVLTRFESERRALALLNHPNIARVHDAGATETGRPYFVMELVPGIPLLKFCDEHSLRPEARLELFVQICEAIQHAHQKGIIHRDIKPANILVAFQDGRPTPKIIDFGVAKSVDHRLTEATLFTAQGQLIGTPEYMSPEQADPTALDIDTRTDVYALGVLLHELLVGALPIDSSTLRRGGLADLQRRIREEESSSPSSRLHKLGARGESIARARSTTVRNLGRLLRGDLDGIVLKAIEKDRTRRYATASELALDVRRFLLREPVLARAPGSLSLAWRWVRRRRRAMILAGGLLGLALGAFVAYRAYLLRADAEARQAAARNLLQEGRGHTKLDRAAKEELAALEVRWRRLARELERGKMPWELGEERELYRRLQAARLERNVHFDRATIAFHRALGLLEAGLPLHSEVERELAVHYAARFREAFQGGALSEEDLALVRSYGGGVPDLALDHGKVHLDSEPAGVDVYCFRWELREERLVPLPFDSGLGSVDPARGILGEPSIEVAAVNGPGAGAFRVGDRLEAVGGVQITTLTSLAGALGGRPAGSVLEVAVRRAGSTVVLSWSLAADTTSLAPGRAAYQGQGLELNAAPLDFLDRCKIGTTSLTAPLERTLPRGSYLFCFKKAGRADARVLLAVPEVAPPVRVRLLEPAQVPSGFLWIPAGPVAPGADPEADQPLDPAATEVAGFFLARNEVTFGEYLELLNSPEIASRIDPGTGELELHGGQTVGLVPRQDATTLLLERSPGSGRWELRSQAALQADMPVLGVSERAAVVYAEWLTAQHRGRWRFRLPTDLEWEKAARGADRRHFAWGSFPLWTYCRSGLKGGETRPGPVADHPADESPYGLRDMTGSVLEPTSGTTREGYTSLRGGSWREPWWGQYHSANRLGRKKDRAIPGVDLGIRLAADAVE